MLNMLWDASHLWGYVALHALRAAGVPHRVLKASEIAQEGVSGKALLVPGGGARAKAAALKPGDGEIDEAAVSALREKFNAALGNDLNTSLAITALYDVLKYKTNDATKLFVLDDFDKVLSLDLCKKADEIRKRNAAEKPAAGAYAIFCEDGSDDPAVTAQIQARYDAKKAKNFAEADRIRDELKSQGIEITDIPGGAKWKHI
mgnify:CR=1 FL=1